MNHIRLTTTISLLTVICSSLLAQRPAKATPAEQTAAAHFRNPIVQTCFTTDPAPLNVGDSVLYLFTGHDEERADFFWMQEWRVYSTRDMVNWTDHGSPHRSRELLVGRRSRLGSTGH